MRRSLARYIRSCSRSSLCFLLALCYSFCLCAGGGISGTERTTLAQDRPAPVYMTSEQAAIPDAIRTRQDAGTKNGNSLFPFLHSILWASLFSLCTSLLTRTPHTDLLPRQTDIRGLLPLPTAPPRCEPSFLA